ncbi:MAG: Flp family type IVb pilin [Deltaproteobacteria bacterium]|jgi:pilus assembly protein Flp/PilA|nr:Flp family type IVb pilin [Deltaproteobacteria bacterium]
MNMIKRFIKDESGATAIEYGLIAGLVAVAVIAALTALGGSLNNLFSDISDTVAASSG